jgi:hypothetical protein
MVDFPCDCVFGGLISMGSMFPNTWVHGPAFFRHSPFATTMTNIDLMDVAGLRFTRGYREDMWLELELCERGLCFGVTNSFGMQKPPPARKHSIQNPYTAMWDTARYFYRRWGDNVVLKKLDTPIGQVLNPQVKHPVSFDKSCNRTLPVCVDDTERFKADCLKLEQRYPGIFMKSGHRGTNGGPRPSSWRRTETKGSL